MPKPSRPAGAKKPPAIPPHPLAVIRRARDDYGIREAVVGISCGKDSIAALSVAAEHLDRVAGYFMFIVPSLEFQERYLAYIERRFKITIHRIPHFQLSDMLRAGTTRLPTAAASHLRSIKPRHIDAHVRKLTGMEWIVSGEKAIDSVERNAMLRNCGGIDTKRRRIFPLTYWSHSTVYNHLKDRQIALSPEYSQAAVGQKVRSFGGLQFRDIFWIREKYPEDYAKICSLFPLVEGQILRHLQRAKAEQQNGQEEISQP